MTILYDLIYLLAVCLLWPYWVYRRLKRGPSNLPAGELFGRVPSRPVAIHCVWIHGVSLGEINATRTIVAELKRQSPNTAIVVSSTTRTGLDRAHSLYPHLTVFRFPLDFSFVIRRVLNHIRPSAVVLMELEIWPNLLEIADARNIPVLIANGRITSDKSMRRFNLPVVKMFARRMAGLLTYVAAQDQIYADRFIELGVPRQRVEVTGSVKYDAADIADAVEDQDELAAAMGIDRRKPLLVAGSTGPDEEAILLDAYAELLKIHTELQLVIVPRKPERFDQVASLIVDRGYACLRRSTGTPVFPERVEGTRHVYLGDTMGELRKFYGLATVVFVGRSLVRMGGSDVMEPAGLAKPILIGPHTENFVEAVALLTAAEACRKVGGAAEIVATLNELLGSPKKRAAMGAAARRVIVERRGATQRIVERIVSKCSLNETGLT